MPSAETLNFLEMVRLKFEFTAQELANPKKMQEITGVRFATGYDHERYRQFKAAIERCCRKLIENDVELNDNLNLQGVRPISEPPLMRFEVVPGARVIHVFPSDLSIHSVIFSDAEEMEALAYILTVWQNAWMQGVDPEAAVRARLAEQGITTWEDFEANKERMQLIRNPFNPPV